jgi:hypothetical protein
LYKIRSPKGKSSFSFFNNTNFSKTKNTTKHQGKYQSSTTTNNQRKQQSTTTTTIDNREKSIAGKSTGDEIHYRSTKRGSAESSRPVRHENSISQSASTESTDPFNYTGGDYSRIHPEELDLTSEGSSTEQRSFVHDRTTWEDSVDLQLQAPQQVCTKKQLYFRRSTFRTEEYNGRRLVWQDRPEVRIPSGEGKSRVSKVFGVSSKRSLLQLQRASIWPVHRAASFDQSPQEHSTRHTNSRYSMQYLPRRHSSDGSKPGAAAPKYEGGHSKLKSSRLGSQRRQMSIGTKPNRRIHRSIHSVESTSRHGDHGEEFQYDEVQSAQHDNRSQGLFESSAVNIGNYQLGDKIQQLGEDLQDGVSDSDFESDSSQGKILPYTRDRETRATTTHSTEEILTVLDGFFQEMK